MVRHFAWVGWGYRLERALTIGNHTNAGYKVATPVTRHNLPMARSFLNPGCTDMATPHKKKKANDAQSTQRRYHRRPRPSQSYGSRLMTSSPFVKQSKQFLNAGIKRTADTSVWRNLALIARSAECSRHHSSWTPPAGSYIGNCLTRSFEEQSNNN